MSGSGVRENRMHRLIGGRWRSSSHGEPERCTRRETGGVEPGRLPPLTSQRPTSQVDRERAELIELEGIIHDATRPGRRKAVSPETVQRVVDPPWALSPRGRSTAASVEGISPPGRGAYQTGCSGARPRFLHPTEPVAETQGAVDMTLHVGVEKIVTPNILLVRAPADGFRNSLYRHGGGIVHVSLRSLHATTPVCRRGVRALLWRWPARSSRQAVRELIRVGLMREARVSRIANAPAIGPSRGRSGR